MTFTVKQKIAAVLLAWVVLLAGVGALMKWILDDLGDG